MTPPANKQALRAARLGAVALVAGITGCGINCDRNPDQAPVEWRGGVVTDKGNYDSSPDGFDGPYLPFPPGRTYRFFHGLGGKPRVIQTWLAFSERCGAQERGIERSAEAAGNQVTIEKTESPDYFDIRNDTCSDVCLRAVAEDPILETSPPEEPQDSGATPPESTDGG